jgi:O-antigen ligase
LSGRFRLRQLQDAGFELLTRSPVGIGFDNFSALIASGAIRANQALVHAHNTFIQVGLDGGWLGLTGFLILTVGAVWVAFRSKGSTAQVSFGAALAGFLVQVTQDYFFFEPASLIFFGLLIAGALTKASAARFPDYSVGANAIPTVLRQEGKYQRAWTSARI